MNPSLPLNGLTTECGHSFHQDWSPPASILEAASGDDGLIDDLIDAFSTDSDARIGQMREALATPDFPTIRFEAHTIKGSARQMGANAVAEVCQELEMVSALQDTRLIAARLNRLQELFEDIRSAMTSYSNSRKMDLALSLFQ
jgi:HPt (histidine-containing phosphotransfer) domain-containing protein